MPRVRIEDRRELHFPMEALIEAIVGFDRLRNGWLWRGSDFVVSVGQDPEHLVTLTAQRSPDLEPESRTFDRAYVGAALIHFCALLHVPLPRHSEKQVAVTADGAVLTALVAIEGPQGRAVRRILNVEETPT